MTCPGCFSPREETRYRSYRRLGGPWDLSGWMRKISPPTRVLTPTAQLVVGHYTDYAIPAACENGSLTFCLLSCTKQIVLFIFLTDNTLYFFHERGTLNLQHSSIVTADIWHSLFALASCARIATQLSHKGQFTRSRPCPYRSPAMLCR